MFYIFFKAGLAKVRVVNKMEAESPARQNILNNLINKLEKTKILTKAYQDMNPVSKLQIKDALNEIDDSFTKPVYIFEKLEQNPWTLE
jgi:hypothetical protein